MALRMVWESVQGATLRYCRSLKGRAPALDSCPKRAKFRNPCTPLNFDASAGVQEFLSKKICNFAGAFVRRAGLGVHDTSPGVHDSEEIVLGRHS